MCGTFNPPHIGHLILAQTALHELGLDKVLFLPVGDPTHKQTGTPLEHRLKMTQLAIADNLDFELDTTDAFREEPHYTSTLLPLLKSKYLSARFWLLIGGDSLATFPHWHQPNQLLEHCDLAVLNRPGYDPDLAELAETVPNLPNQVTFLNGPYIHLSSSWLRENLAKDERRPYLLPAAVAEYANSHKLYV